MKINRWAVAAAMVAMAAAGSAAARDPWFPDGPVEAQIPHDVVLPLRVRQPQFPLKTARTLHTNAEIATARANVARFPQARAVADHIIAEADYWKAWSDQDLRGLITGPEVPRAVGLCDAGCPVHGLAIFQINGGTTYPWIVDPRHPFQVKCPVGGETYPDNDYGAYYRSGFKDRSKLAGKIVDDGWGWVGPDGKRYWFVAYANHMLWQGLDPDSRCINTAILFLGRAYLLTGDRAYAHKAAVLLRQVAAVYPTMNYEQQSREGELMGREGTRYTGKIANGIWEAYQVAPELSEGYDDIWETIDGDAGLQRFYHESGRQIRAFIEANYLEEAIDTYFADKMRGNYGTHQAALLKLAVVRQHGDNARYVAEVLHRAEGHMLRIGFDYGLFNLVYRDGEAHESPDYNFVWPRVFATSAGLLKQLGAEFPYPDRLKRMYDAPLRFIAIGSHSPALGDSQNRFAPVIGEDAVTYRRALALFHDPRYAAFLGAVGEGGAKGYTSFDTLFFAPIPDGPRPDGRAVAPQPSHIFSGYGYAFLNNPSDTCSLGIFYGLHVAHYHHDRLHFDLFANGQSMVPSLGYPDGANEFNPGIFTWSKTSVAHNTVTVDAHRQPANPEGNLLLFADGSFARTLTADASATYPQTRLYRRTLVMVDAPAASGAASADYAVDFFDVTGGRQHDYSLHGPTGTFTALGGTLTAPAPGTLAGPNVAVGALYDDPVRGAPGFKGSYLNYEGSGFQHLVHVQHLSAGAATFVAEYAHEKDPNARIRIRVLPQPGQDLMLADARVSPMKFPQRVKFLIARRTAGPGEPELSSRFAAVLEPYAREPLIQSVRRQDVPGASVVAIVRAGGETDWVIHRQGPAGAVAVEAPLPLSTDGEVAVVTIDGRGRAIRAFLAGGTYLRAGGRELRAQPFSGAITAIDVARSRVRVRPLEGGAPIHAADWVGRVIHMTNSLRQTVQTIASVERDGAQLWIGFEDDLRVGRVRVHAISGETIATQSGLRIAGSYRGVTVCSAADLPLATVAAASADQLTLAAPPAAPIRAGDDVWLIDGAVGETVRIDATASWRSAAP